MKLLNFKGLKLNEYIDVDIEFKENLSILTGTNGSGKTTSLNLIQAILLPNLLDFFITPFEFISLAFIDKNKEYSIHVKKNKQEIIFFVYNNLGEIQTEELRLSRNLVNELEIYRTGKRILDIMKCF